MSDLVITYSRVMKAEIDRLNVIAQNVANVNSVGYVARTTAIDGAGFLKLVEGEGNPVVTGHARDQSAISETGVKTNLASLDDSWFVVRKDGGSLYVTRGGAFHVNQDGDLRLNDDYAVIGNSGEIRGVTTELTVERNGDIVDSKGFVDQLRLVKVPNLDELSANGDGVYLIRNHNGVIDVAPEDKAVLQGALNTSNVKIGDEMVRLTEITRHIESVQRAMSAYDDMLDSAINQLGK